MTIAWRYGMSELVDAYVFVFNLVNLPISIWFGILTFVLLPLVARIRNDTPSELSQFRNELLGLGLIVSSALGVLMWFGLPLLLQSHGLGLSQPVLGEALDMGKGLVFMTPIGVVISLFSAWIMTTGRHRNTLFEAIPSLVILLALLLPPIILANPLLWGTLAGFAFHLLILSETLLRNGQLLFPHLALALRHGRAFEIARAFFLSGKS